MRFHQHGKDTADHLFLFMSGDDHINHAMLLQIFGSLEIFRQFFTHGFFDHAVALTIPDQSAALNAGEMVTAAHDTGIGAETATGIIDAMEKAATRAERNGGGIIISGSLYLAGHVLAENGTLPA